MAILSRVRWGAKGSKELGVSGSDAMVESIKRQDEGLRLKGIRATRATCDRDMDAVTLLRRASGEINEGVETGVKERKVFLMCEAGE